MKGAVENGGGVVENCRLEKGPPFLARRKKKCWKSVHVRHFKHVPLFETFRRLLLAKSGLSLKKCNNRMPERSSRDCCLDKEKGQETNLLSAQFKKRGELRQKVKLFKCLKCVKGERVGRMNGKGLQEGKRGL